MAMDDEEGASAMAMSTRPAVRAIKANAALNYKM
jgi:hypothetical protein